MRLLQHALALLLALPCLSSAGLADERLRLAEHRDGKHALIHVEFRHGSGLWMEYGHRKHRHRRHREQRIGELPGVVMPWFAYAPRLVPPAPAMGRVWYFCAYPLGYFPYVENCMVAWQVVPAR